MRLELLKEILAVPTRTGDETLMIQWLLRYFAEKGITATVDQAGNVYAIKGTPAEGCAYPCVCAHTDTVHAPEKVTIVQKGDHIWALDEDRRKTGLGGDDKSGIFICLELLERLPVLKAAFFTGEEVGCLGSQACDEKFFADVGYVMEFDSPCESIMTYTCNGVKLFPDTGPFIEAILPILDAHGVDKWQNHPYTDVSVLKRKFDFPCLNLPAGYFRMHTKEEYVSEKAVANAVKLGLNLVAALGSKKYQYVEPEHLYAGGMLVCKPARPVTSLRVHG